MQPETTHPHGILERIRNSDLESSLHFKTIFFNPHSILQYLLN